MTGGLHIFLFPLLLSVVYLILIFLRFSIPNDVGCLSEKAVYAAEWEED